MKKCDGQSGRSHLKVFANQEDKLRDATGDLTDFEDSLFGSTVTKERTNAQPFTPARTESCLTI
jgi:hypothetical protein